MAEIGRISNVRLRTLGEKRYCFAAAPISRLKGVTYVPVVEASSKTYVREKPGGYQRPGSRYRMRRFRDYLLEHTDQVVPPVLLSAADWRFEPYDGYDVFGDLVLESDAAIIDGQHRLGGYIALLDENDQDRDVDFIAIMGLSEAEEKEEFLTVNNNQKGVPRALTAYLEDEVGARVAWALNEEKDSPFFQRITRTTMTRDRLFALHSVAKGVDRTFNHGKLVHLDEDARVDAMIQYWSIIADVLEEEWSDIDELEKGGGGKRAFQSKLLELTGFLAWSNIGAEILSRSYQEGVGFHWDHVRTLVDAASKVSWEKDGQYEGMTGEYGAGVIKRDMERLLPAEASAEHGYTDEQEEHTNEE